MTPRATTAIVAAVLALAAGATDAPAQDRVPYDNAGGGQYLPAVPGGGGSRPEIDVRNEAGPAESRLPRSLVQRLERRGPEGAAAAAAAAATAPESEALAAAVAARSGDEPASPLERLALAGADLAAEIAAPLGPTPETESEQGMEVGFVADQFGGDLLTNADPEIRDEWWERLAATNSSLVRINLYWNQVADIAEPADPADPAEESYDWTIPDGAVREAAERGLGVVFTVVGAPRWAEGSDHPPEDSYRVGSWKPDPEAFGEFAKAAASRYSGGFEDLPRVRYWEAWNEPNIPQYLAPQWDGEEPRSPAIYRELLNSFYAAVKSVHRSNRVIAAGTSSLGDEAGGTRMRPYLFWRELLCLEDPELLPRTAEDCATGRERAHLDIFSHHPINGTPGAGPADPPPDPDDGVPANFAELGRIVAAAETAGTVLPAEGERPGWATEVWYESNPPEKKAVSLAKQARFMEQAMFTLWEQGATATFFLQLRDEPYDPELPPLVGFQTGVYLPDDAPKPSLEAVRFPFVAERLDATQARVWGRAPRSGELAILGRGAGRSELAEFSVRRGRVFETVVELPADGSPKRLQAEVGGEASLPWPLD